MVDNYGLVANARDCVTGTVSAPEQRHVFNGLLFLTRVILSAHVHREKAWHALTSSFPHLSCNEIQCLQMGKG